MSQMSLLDVEPTRGAARTTDPTSSQVAAGRCSVGSQRWQIAQAFALGAGHVTADGLAARDPKDAHRSSWSARCGQLVHDGNLEHGPMVPGNGQEVLSYVLTDRGRAWVTDLMGPS